jgi:hypothetical protein
MLGREVVKSKQDFFIFLEALTGFWELDLVTGEELIKGWESGFAVGARYISWISCFALP